MFSLLSSVLLSPVSLCDGTADAGFILKYELHSKAPFLLLLLTNLSTWTQDLDLTPTFSALPAVPGTCDAEAAVELFVQSLLSLLLLSDFVGTERRRRRGTRQHVFKICVSSIVR